MKVKVKPEDIPKVRVRSNLARSTMVIKSDKTYNRKKSKAALRRLQDD